jgi:cbb3-type cytochrome oxidase subunit 3
VMFVLGLAFSALWTTAYVLGRKIENQQAARLPG